MTIASIPAACRDEIAAAAIEYVDAMRRGYIGNSDLIRRNALRDTTRDRLFFAVDRAQARRLDTRKVKP
jgi:hypothetical protein